MSSPPLSSSASAADKKQQQQQQQQQQQSCNFLSKHINEETMVKEDKVNNDDNDKNQLREQWQLCRLIQSAEIKMKLTQGSRNSAQTLHNRRKQLKHQDQQNATTSSKAVADYNKSDYDDVGDDYGDVYGDERSEWLRRLQNQEASKDAIRFQQNEQQQDEKVENDRKKNEQKHNKNTDYKHHVFEKDEKNTNNKCEYERNENENENGNEDDDDDDDARPTPTPTNQMQLQSSSLKATVSNNSFAGRYTDKCCDSNLKSNLAIENYKCEYNNKIHYNQMKQIQHQSTSGCSKRRSSATTFATNYLLPKLLTKMPLDDDTFDDGNENDTFCAESSKNLLSLRASTSSPSSLAVQESVNVDHETATPTPTCQKESLLDALTTTTTTPKAQLARNTQRRSTITSCSTSAMPTNFVQVFADDERRTRRIMSSPCGDQKYTNSSRQLRNKTATKTTTTMGSGERKRSFAADLIAALQAAAASTPTPQSSQNQHQPQPTLSSSTISATATKHRKRNSIISLLGKAKPRLIYHLNNNGNQNQTKQAYFQQKNNNIQRPINQYQMSYHQYQKQNRQQKTIETYNLIPEIGFKIVVMGATKVGKSSIVTRFLYDSFDEKHLATIEDNYFVEFPHQKNTINISITDTSGTYQFPAMRKLSINSGDAFILVYSVDCVESFEELERLRQEILNEREQSFLELCGSISSNESTSLATSTNSSSTTNIGTDTISASSGCSYGYGPRRDSIPMRRTSVNVASNFDRFDKLYNNQSSQQQHKELFSSPSSAATQKFSSALALDQAVNQSSLSSSSVCSSATSSSNDVSCRSSMSAAEAALRTRRTPNPPIVIVANKTDLPPEKHLVNSDEIEALVLIDWNNGFCRSSAARNENINEIFQQVLLQAKQPLTMTEAIVSKRRKSLPPKLAR